MGQFLKIVIGVISFLTFVSCGPSSDSKKASVDSKMVLEKSKNELINSDETSCRFSGESDDTSIEEHFENIKQALNGPNLSKYYMSCGSFLGNDRYYLDLVTPAAQKILIQIRAIQPFKNLAFKSLMTTKSDDENYLKIIDVNSNWRNDDQVASILVKLVLSKDVEIRMAAAGALKGTTSAVAISKLIQMLENKNQSIRIASVTALEGTENLEARKAVFPLRKDSEFGVRIQAMFVPAP